MNNGISDMIAGPEEISFSPQGSLYPGIRRLTKYFAGIVITIALLTLIGWQFDIELLKRPIPHLVSMNPVSAILFIFSCSSFLLLVTGTISSQKIVAGRILASLVLLTGLLRFISNYFDLIPSVDTLLFADKLNRGIGQSISSRMASGTAVNFMLTSICLLLLNYETRGKKMPSQIIALIIGLFALLFIIGYLYHVDAIYGIIVYIPMAVNTAICFLFLSLAILFANPGKGFIKELISPLSGGIIARYLIPAAIIVPVILGALRLIATWQGGLPLELGVALLVISIIIIFLVLTWFIVLVMNRRDTVKLQSENSLRASEEQIRIIFSAAPDAIIVIDEEGKIVKWNPRAEALLGWKEKEVEGQLLSDLIIPQSFRQAHKKGLSHFLKTGEGPLLGKIVETAAVTKDGREIDVALNIAASPAIRGKYLFIGFIRDITGQKKSEEKFKALLDSAPDAMIISDKNGTIVLINKQTETLFGYERDELIGRPIEVLIPGDFRAKHAGHRTHYFAEPKVRSMGAGLELFAIRKDGIQFPVEISLSPLQTEEGMLVSAAIRDITERKKLDEKFRSLLNSAPDATVIVNEEGIIEMINYRTESLFGYSRDEMIGQPVEILIPIDLRQKHVHHRADYIKMPRVRAMGAGIELNAVKKNGTTFPVEISLSPIQTEEGILVSASVRDISLRKELQDELKKSTMEMEAFTYSVSHDLRAPLRGIIGFTAILEEDYVNKLDDEAKRITSVIKHNTMKMGHLIDDLLTFSRIGKKEVVKTHSDSQAIVDEIVQESLQQNKSDNKPIFHIHPLPPVKADMNTLRQVWINLISNAIKYSATKKNPRIEIGSYSENAHTVFYIKDNGVGFDDQYKDKLFKVFQRLHGPDEFEGTGVGLALVEKIITKHDGKVWAEGKENEGACFYFSLPD